MVILGAANIYRNPCLDPGDLRIVQAVNRTELHEWPNVLLLPASKSCQRSLSSECSGGDLDGDQFSIIWDDRLIPPTHREFQPVDYADVLAVAQKSHACELAQQQPLAVDCPKTGIPPTIPAHARAMIRKHRYPDFMEKKDKMTYTSMNIMGCLYRSIVTTACVASF